MSTARFLLFAFTLLFGIAAAFAPAYAQVPTLVVTDRATTRSYTLRELLASPRRADVTLPDRIYGKTMTWRAIPMLDFLRNMRIGADDYIKATATDNFAVEMPVRLMRNAQPEVEAFLAIEDPAQKWPKPPPDADRDTVGPFYLVWKVVAPAHVSRDYWAAQLKDLTVTDSPLKRWPALAVGDDLPTDDPIRTGLDRYVTLCITCHKVHGTGGTGAGQGPDLGQKSVLELFDSPATLRKFIRRPVSVRADSKMPRFDDLALSDEDLDAMIAWLAYKAKHPQ